MVISGKKISQKWFLFDGCHKFYLLDSNRCTKDIKERGYSETDIHPIDDLPYMFYNSCPLRFIEVWKDYKSIVPQCRRFVTFKGFGKFGWTAKIDFDKDKVYTDEPAADYSPCPYVIHQRFA